MRRSQGTGRGSEGSLQAARQRRGRGRAALGALALAFAIAAIAPSAALAEHHFCPQGPGPQQCAIPAGVAADAESGLVYIADENEATSRVQVFDEDGAYVRTIGAGVLKRPRGIAVDNDPASPTPPRPLRDRRARPPARAALHPERRTAAGLRLGGRQRHGGAADLRSRRQPADGILHGRDRRQRSLPADRPLADRVGAGGEVFIADSAGKETEPGFEGFKDRLMKFAPSGTCEEELVFPEPSQKTFNAIAVDSEGSSYLAVAGEEVEIRKLSAGGSVQCSLALGLLATALAVDPASDRLYVGQSEAPVKGGGLYLVITIFEPGCAGEAATISRRFGYGQILTATRGLAVLPGVLDPERAGDPVLSEGFGSAFDAFHLTQPPPGPIIAPGSVVADPVSNTKATLGAEVNAEGKQTEFEIEYIEQATCEADEGAGGECFEEAESSGAETLPEEGFALQGPEALVGCAGPVERRWVPAAGNDLPLPRQSPQRRRRRQRPARRRLLHDPPLDRIRPSLGELGRHRLRAPEGRAQPARGAGQRPLRGGRPAEL